ncbi:MAG: 2-hydroxyacid dehydrogenase [Planctomycetes bacterium]|jgi:D-lactate dehydrogenase|nr:2-hydroxyacid dehydrogenase [Planctomycetota bacterium]
MKVAIFSAKPYDRASFDRAVPRFGHELTYFEARLHRATVPLAEGSDAVCAFVNDDLDAGVLLMLARRGVRTVALRCAGYNNVDLAAAKELDVTVVRVPAYSPHAVAEHTLALTLCLLRKLHRAYNRVREGNFNLEGLLGMELHGRTVGIIGTGKIGLRVGALFHAFGATVLAHDPHPPDQPIEGMRFVTIEELIATSDLISLHCPLTPQTHHLIDGQALAHMKPGAVIINTSRGGLINTADLIEALKDERVAGLGIDVYEEEEHLFFEDRSGGVIRDDQFARLLTFPNVVITGHQAFFTAPALEAIAEVTLGNLAQLEAEGTCDNTVIV